MTMDSLHVAIIIDITVCLYHYTTTQGLFFFEVAPLECMYFFFRIRRSACYHSAIAYLLFAYLFFTDTMTIKADDLSHHMHMKEIH